MTALYLYLWELPDGSILGRAGAWTERPKFEPITESGQWVRYSAVRDEPVVVKPGHDCTVCGSTVDQCNAHIKRQGVGCCSRCYSTDTHGLSAVRDDEGES